MAYVKFLRGTFNAYNNLTTKDNNTLYFIYDGVKEEPAALYLGEKKIAGWDIAGLNNLTDIVLSTVAENDILIYRNGQWENASINELALDSIQELQQDLADLDTDLTTAENNIIDLQNSIADVYTKAETEAAIGTAIAAQAHLKRKLVDKVSDINANAEDALDYIYMVSTGNLIEDNKYDEYLVLEVNGGRVVERVGSWEVNLDDYAKVADLTALSTTVETNKTEIQNSLAAEIQRATGAEEANATAAAGALKAAQDEATRATAAEKALGERIDAIDFIDNDELNTALEPYAKISVLDNYALASDVQNSLTAIQDTLNDKANAATTLAGYGITDAYTKAETDKAIADKVADVTGGESAAAVKLLLEAEVTRSTEKDNAHDTALTNLANELNANYVSKTEFTTTINNIYNILTWQDLTSESESE